MQIKSENDSCTKWYFAELYPNLLMPYNIANERWMQF